MFVIPLTAVTVALAGVFGAITLALLMNLEEPFEVSDFGWRYLMGDGIYEKEIYRLSITVSGQWNLLVANGNSWTQLWHYKEPMSKDLLERTEVLIQQIELYQTLNKI